MGIEVEHGVIAKLEPLYELLPLIHNALTNVPAGIEVEQLARTVSKPKVLKLPGVHGKDTNFPAGMRLVHEENLVGAPTVKVDPLLQTVLVNLSNAGDGQAAITVLFPNA